MKAKELKRLLENTNENSIVEVYAEGMLYEIDGLTFIPGKNSSEPSRFAWENEDTFILHYKNNSGVPWRGQGPLRDEEKSTRIEIITEPEYEI